MNKRQISQIIILFTSLFMLIIFVCCNNQHVDNNAKIIYDQNKTKDFSSWKNWNISYRDGSGYYIANHKTSIDDAESMLVFIDSTWCFTSIRFRLPKNDIDNYEWSPTYPIKECSQNLIDSLGLSFNYNILQEHLDFIAKYKLEQVSFCSDPDRIYFQSKDVNLLYLFSPQLKSPYEFFSESFDENWFFETLKR